MRFDIGETWIWFKNVLFWISNYYQVLVQVYMCITTHLLFDISCGKKQGLVFTFVLAQSTSQMFVLLLLWASNKYLAWENKPVQLKLQVERDENSSTILVLERLKCMFFGRWWWKGEWKGQFCKCVKWNFCSLTVETHLYNICRVCMSRK